MNVTIVCVWGGSVGQCGGGSCRVSIVSSCQTLDKHTKGLGLS